MVTSTRARVPATPSETPRVSSQRAKGSDNVLAPKAAEKKPAKVTPTWTAARNWLGSLRSRCTACPRLPVSAIARTCDSRRETRAISAPENTPPIRTKATTMMMLSQTSLTGGVLLGGSGVERGRVHGAWSRLGPGVAAAPRTPSGACDVTFLSDTDGGLGCTVSLGLVTNRDQHFVRSLPCATFPRVLRPPPATPAHCAAGPGPVAAPP